MKSPFSLITVVLIFISILYFRLGNPNWKKGDLGILAWDNFGYHLYLPATFIYDDLGLNNVQWVHEVRERYNAKNQFYQAHYLEGKGHVIQYTIGTALIYSPAFFVAHIYAKSSETFLADGFSQPYQLAILIESFILVFIGLFYLRKLLLFFFKDKIVSLIILLFLLGTNYYQISIANTTTPHSFLFAFYAVLTYLTVKWHKKPKISTLLLFSFLFGLLCLTRANDILFLLIPLFWGVYSKESFKNKLQFFLKHKLQLLAAAGIIALMGLIQLLYWKYASGKWVYDSYTNEDFKFLSPYLWEYLFSFKKGLFIYSPILVFSLVGLVVVIKKKKEVFISLALFIVLYVWVLSSWDCWWYADSYGQRSIVQAYPVLCLPFGFFINWLVKRKWVISIPIFIILLVMVYVNLFQVHQQRYDIIHTSRMTYEYYKRIFLQRYVDENFKNYLEPQRNINYLPPNLYYNTKLLYASDFNNTTDNVTLSPQRPYFGDYTESAIGISENRFPYIKASIRYKITDFDPNSSIGFVFSTIDHISDKNYGYSHHSVQLDSSVVNKGWLTFEKVYAPPYFRNEEDTVKVFIWLNGNASVLLDKYKVEAYLPTPIMPERNTYNYGFLQDNFGKWVNPNPSENDESILDSSLTYGTTLELNESAKLGKYDNYTIYVNGRSVESKETVGVIISIESEGKAKYYKTYTIFPDTSYKEFSFSGSLPDDIPENSLLKFYLYNNNHINFKYKELKIKFD